MIEVQARFSPGNSNCNDIGYESHCLFRLRAYVKLEVLLLYSNFLENLIQSWITHLVNGAKNLASGSRAHVDNQERAQHALGGHFSLTKQYLYCFVSIVNGGYVRHISTIGHRRLRQIEA